MYYILYHTMASLIQYHTVAFYNILYHTISYYGIYINHTASYHGIYHNTVASSIVVSPYHTVAAYIILYPTESDCIIPWKIIIPHHTSYCDGRYRILTHRIIQWHPLSYCIPQNHTVSYRRKLLLPYHTSHCIIL